MTMAFERGCAIYHNTELLHLLSLIIPWVYLLTSNVQFQSIALDQLQRLKFLHIV